LPDPFFPSIAIFSPLSILNEIFLITYGRSSLYLNDTFLNSMEFIVLILFVPCFQVYPKTQKD
jgi:hypothetical protein